MERNLRGTLVGTVISDKMTKTITVLVKTEKKHSLYAKKTVTTKKYKAHDEKQEAHVGDVVHHDVVVVNFDFSFFYVFIDFIASNFWC